MTWDWHARGPLPHDATATGTTAGGSIDNSTKAWPRYEAEYLKRALTSERYKYDTEGLDEAQKSVYLDKVVADYKAEADECLKAEFEQWLQGMHEANDPTKEQIYENRDGKPVRKWMFREKESMDDEGGYKINQARAGWKHTPWGRAPLTHLPGVREYLQSQVRNSMSKDQSMQFLAEFGPQNLEQAWDYFKHWVKGRPLSDAVALQPAFPDQPDRTVGNMMPQRMYAYDSSPNDRQPGVLASDAHARTAAVALPGEAPKSLTDAAEDRHVQMAKRFQGRLEDFMKGMQIRDLPDTEPREKAAERADLEQIEAQAEERVVERQDQAYRRADASVPDII